MVSIQLSTMATGKMSWEEYKNKMKEKRCKKGKVAPIGKGLNTGELILQKSELVIQRLSSEVSGKAQKHNRHGPREFVQFLDEQVTIPAIKNACEKHFKSLTNEGLVCDVLASDQGPSCSSIDQVPDLKVVHVRFIKPPIKVEDSVSCTNKQYGLSVPAYHTDSPRKRRAISESSSQAHKRQAVPKSLTLSQMMKLGKSIKTTGETVVIDIYAFDFAKLSWSLIPNKVEFTMDDQVLGEGGFRKAYKASSSSYGFVGQTWVIKRFLDKIKKEIEEDLQQSMEEQGKKVVQMHHLSKNFADQLAQTIKERDAADKFGPLLQFEQVYFGKIEGTGECITLERFIEGTFQKYINNTGELCVPEDDLIGQKASCLSHFSYERSNKQLMVLDLQGNGHLLFDPEIASTELVADNNEYMFCAGNLSVTAIKQFIDNHKCNMFCRLAGL